MKNRHVGLLIVGISIFIGFLIWLFNKSLTAIVNESCSHGPTCPMWDSISLQTNIGIAVLVFVLIIGLYMIFFAKDNIETPVIREVHKIKVIKEMSRDVKSKTTNDNIKRILSSLTGDERSIYNLVIDADGSVFQSELSKSTGYSKVKVTRILDRLEGKGVIERKRRGMTNIVLLKHN